MAAQASPPRALVFFSCPFGSCPFGALTNLAMERGALVVSGAHDLHTLGIESWLRARGISTLVFGDCNFRNCARTSMCQASELRNIGVSTLRTTEIAQELAWS